MKNKSIKVLAPSFSELWSNPVLMLGFGFGSGLLPKGPGTAGTLLGLLLFIPLLLWNEWLAWAVLLLGTLFGSTICGKSSEYLDVHDHGGIVWDEFVGIWLVLILLPEQSFLYWMLAFAMFRLFDIWKPWPILWVDHKVEGGFGIMLDDILAAIYAVAVIWGYHLFKIS
ncbi:phosphatidylglycerophosphatase A family protein [Thiomicrorhabdus arctica]|uniref:phosphatidylglycerophosphatase A family protein n=1 Tax=Thiomicrorhabdus arctica TaxID=131540 RepID=UPI000368EF57|nr:phosphatidylglycerophosphatase A [Thiomicrorhabdus arctica]